MKKIKSAWVMQPRVLLNYLWYIVLSLIILFSGLFLLPIVSSGVFIEALKEIDPATLYMVAMAGPVSVYSWLSLFTWFIVVVWPFFAFIVWAVRDSRKFVALGINTRPFLWGIGMIFPLIIVVFPLYFIRRNITWAKEKQEIILANEHKKGLVSWLGRTDFITENIKMKINKGLNVLKWTAVILVGLFGLGVLFRIPFFIEDKKTEEQVAKIHATKLTMDDVMGVNLPPDPGAEAGKTVAGIDVNNNGIRDDVELAIFKEYPDSAKTRAVLLQYALALQMEVVQPMVNKGTVTAVAEKTSGGYYCIGEITSREDLKKFIEVGDRLHGFIESRQLNTEAREKAKKDFYEGNLGSYELPSDCDIDLMSLPN